MFCTENNFKIMLEHVSNPRDFTFFALLFSHVGYQVVTGVYNSGMTSAVPSVSS